MISFDTYNIEEVDVAFKKGIEFSSDSLVEYSGSAMTVTGATFSVSFWWKPTSTDTFTIFDSGHIKGSQIGSTFKIEFKSYPAGATVSLEISDMLTLNIFQQISVRKTASQLQVYKNLTLAGSTPSTESVIAADSTYLKFEANNGVISDFKLYDKELTDLELYQDYNNALPRNVDELKVYIPFGISSKNLVTTSVVGGSSTLYGLDSGDFLFPEDIKSINEEITFSTLKLAMESGYEQRRYVWKYPLYKWTFDLREKLIDDIGDFITFFINKKGAATAFGYRCPIDGRVYKVRFDDSYARSIMFTEAFTGQVVLQEVR